MLEMTDIQLGAVQIDELSERLASLLAEAGVDQRSALPCRLAFESCLIRLAERMGSGASGQLVVGKRLGIPRLEVRVPGERFDPREVSGLSDWERSLMETSGLSPAYAYRGGCNVVSVMCPLRVDDNLASVLALVLGVGISYAGRLLPGVTRAALLEGLINPLADTFIAVLGAVAGPLVFFSVVWGICGMGDLAALGRSGRSFVGRFAGANALGVLVALGAGALLMPTHGAGGTDDVLASTVQLLLSPVPTNLIQPFLESNTLQIITLGVVVGIATLSLGPAADGLREAFKGLNSLMQLLMQRVCLLLPGFIALMIVSQSWSGTAQALLSSWMPILVTAACIVAVLGLALMTACLSCGISPAKVLQRLVPLGFLAFTTASPSASFGTMMSVCEGDFGVDGGQTSFGVPLGMVLCKPATSVLFPIVVLFCAQMYGGGGSGLFWYVRLGITCALYALAVPPVPGGSLACYGMLFATLGVPAQAIGVATALDLLLDNAVVCTNVVSLVLQVVSAARATGTLDEKALAKLR